MHGGAPDPTARRTASGEGGGEVRAGDTRARWRWYRRDGRLSCTSVAGDGLEVCEGARAVRIVLARRALLARASRGACAYCRIGRNSDRTGERLTSLEQFHRLL